MGGIEEWGLEVNVNGEVNVENSEEMADRGSGGE